LWKKNWVEAEFLDFSPILFLVVELWWRRKSGGLLFFAAAQPELRYVSSCWRSFCVAELDLWKKSRRKTRTFNFLFNFTNSCKSLLEKQYSFYFKYS
jgi:hypothetical protein